MVRRLRSGRRRSGSVPRASGDGPVSSIRLSTTAACSPRERGWSQASYPADFLDWVFPARAGMVPIASDHAIGCGRVPRASGDGPYSGYLSADIDVCSPRERGWSLRLLLSASKGWVFPARAGMVPPNILSPESSFCVPRASGDGPPARTKDEVLSRCSPRERGWSSRPPSTVDAKHVFPARAGMVPESSRQRGKGLGVPRASGDGPPIRAHQSVGPACSPRERGWSHDSEGPARGEVVFPARAGMVPASAVEAEGDLRVPRASGDGPASPHKKRPRCWCSPRERGWSGGRRFRPAGCGVFPARAGMVPSRPTRSSPTCRVPRASGDGP